ncbi:MAG: hypothetical protein ACOC1F_11915 [Myxococcota bacterium]
MGARHDRWALRPSLAGIVAPALIAAGLAFAAPAHTKTAPVALGAVTTRVQRPHIDVPKAFKSEVVRQLRSIDLSDIPDAKHVVLSASLTRLDTRRDGRRAHSSCVVSATLTKKEDGALVAILRGKARAEDHVHEQTSNELAVMRAAVHSAMRGIPNALR